MKETPLQASRERLHQPQMIRRTHDYIATEGTPSGEVLKPTYWVRLADRLRTYDTLTVIEESGQWFAELLVLSSGAHGVHVAPLRGIQLDGRVGVNDEAPRNRTGATVKYRGPQLKWCVLDAEGKPLHEGCASEAEAFGVLHSYARAQK